MRLRRDLYIPYLFLLPAIALLAIFNLFPAIATFQQSLYAEATRRGAEPVLVGLENFVKVFNDPVFWKSLRVTLLFSLIVNPLQTALALGLALVANQRTRGIKLFRSIYLLPVAVSINVTVVVWGLMVDPNAGLINGILNQLGLPEQPFLTSPDQALWAIIMIISWKGVPYWALFFLAALQSIPNVTLEAAVIDGASSSQILTKVIIPILRPIILFVLIADTIVNFTLFVPIQLLTQGGPQLSTNLVMYETYRRGFIYGDLGSSAVMLAVMFIIILVFIGVQYFVFGRSR
ncbi:MAG: ABC transporter permease subunit [Chloroflexi bacterium]|jgi:multiple sugar transport system permease protein|nr:ABC transporter permease subunit [Chloroflexota bacterium]